MAFDVRWRLEIAPRDTPFYPRIALHIGRFQIAFAVSIIYSQVLSAAHGLAFTRLMEPDLTAP